MTTKYGLFSDPAYIRPASDGIKDVSKGGPAMAGFKAGSGNKTGKVRDGSRDVGDN